MERTVVNTPFLPRCMECRCNLAMRKLSVCSSRLSVCQTRGLWQNGSREDEQDEHRTLYL